MIDEERSLEATADRKQLLYHLANFRQSVARVLESLRAYLASGIESDRLEYQQQQYRCVGCQHGDGAIFRGSSGFGVSESGADQFGCRAMDRH